MSVLAVLVGTICWIGVLWLAVGTASFAKGTWSLFPGRNRAILLTQIAFTAVVLVALLAWRSPMLLLHCQLNPDEGQFLTQALTYSVDPLPWRSSNGGSAGPVDSYVLTWPFLLGQHLSYFTARLTGVACVMVTIWFFLRTAALLLGARWALLAVLPMTAFYVFAFENDYVHYSSEHVPVALLAIASYLLLRIYLRPAPGPAFVLGLVLGATEFAKLQAAPLGAYLAVVAASVLLFRKGLRPQFGEIGRPLASLVAGTFVVPALLLGPVIAAGYWNVFFRNYLVFGTTYGHTMISGGDVAAPAQTTPPVAGAVVENVAHPSLVEKLLTFLGHGGEANVYLLVMALLAGVALGLIIVKSRPPATRRWWCGLAVILGYLALAAFVIVEPGTHFHHYLFLAVGPAMLTVLWLMRRGLDRGLLKSARPVSPAWVLACALLTIAPFAAWRALDPYNEGVTQPVYRAASMDDDNVVRFLREQARPGDTMVVWGWAPEYYVCSHIPAGTPDVVGGVYELPGKLSDDYRVGYLQILDRTKPRFFVDAVGVFGWPSWPRPLDRLRATTYPQVADYLKRNYELAATLPQSESRGSVPVLVYIRRE